jgi:hypothetical protein
MMTVFGPVYDAAHGGAGNPWFVIMIGSVVLLGAWIGRYLGPTYVRPATDTVGSLGWSRWVAIRR